MPGLPGCKPYTAMQVVAITLPHLIGCDCAEDVAMASVARRAWCTQWNPASWQRGLRQNLHPTSRKEEVPSKLGAHALELTSCCTKHVRLCQKPGCWPLAADSTCRRTSPRVVSQSQPHVGACRRLACLFEAMLRKALLGGLSVC